MPDPVDSLALRAARTLLVWGPPEVYSTAAQSGNFDGAVRDVYKHQLETGWLPPRLTVLPAEFWDEAFFRLRPISERAIFTEE